MARVIFPFACHRSIYAARDLETGADISAGRDMHRPDVIWSAASGSKTCLCDCVVVFFIYYEGCDALALMPRTATARSVLNQSLSSIYAEGRKFGRVVPKFFR